MCPKPKNIAKSISIHALREEGDNRKYCIPCSEKIFLSTPSARRATFPVLHQWRQVGISIHALREEGDQEHAGAHRQG